MAGGFWAAAVSLLNSSPADGVHLLWSAPSSAGYSLSGYDIQRREASLARPTLNCHTLSAQELQDLHSRLVLELPGFARLAVREAACPDFPARLPDEPIDGRGPPVRHKCLDFSGESLGPGPNPRAEQGLRVMAMDRSRRPLSATEIVTVHDLTGLALPQRLEIDLPEPTAAVELDIACPERIGAEAYDAEGAAVAVATSRGVGWEPESVELRSGTIVRVVVDAPAVGVLFSVCREIRLDRCLNFGRAEVGGGPNPRELQGVLFEALGTDDRPLSETTVVRSAGGNALVCAPQLRISLPAPANRAEVTVVGAGGGTVTAFDARGVAISSVHLIGGDQPQTVDLGGGRMQEVAIAPSGEALLVALCYTPLPWRCVDFEALPAGAGPNPLRAQDLTLEVRGPSGAALAQTTVRRTGGFQGLDCGAELAVDLAAELLEIELTLVTFSTPARVQAFNSDGSLAGAAATSGRGQGETLRLAGAAINRLLVSCPGGEVLLLGVCHVGPLRPCLSFSQLEPQSYPNPWYSQGFMLDVREATGAPASVAAVKANSGHTGLDCGFTLRVTLPQPAQEIHAVLVCFAGPARLAAFDSDGSVAGVATTSGVQRQPERLTVRGASIETAEITAPSDETLLLEVCYLPAVQTADVSATAAWRVGGGRSRRLTPLLPPLASLGVSILSRTAGIVRGAAGAHSACLAYDISFPEVHDSVEVGAGVPAMLAVALRSGKAVDVRQLAQPGGHQQASFQRGAVDQVILYTGRAASALTVCADVPLTLQQEDAEWANVPYVAKGIQLPARALNSGLSTAAAEEALASSRLVAGESFDAARFRDVADLLNEVGARASVASPALYSTLTRGQPDQSFVQLRGWQLATSLVAEAAWRRMLGFGYLDSGAGLQAGKDFDYRITAYFRRRDVEEWLYGFHTVPLGTALPTSFALGGIRLNTFVSREVQIFPAPAAAALRATGRHGIAVAPAGSGGRSLLIRFPTLVQRVVLELEPASGGSLTYEGKLSQYYQGPPQQPQSGTVPSTARAEITFSSPVDLLTLKGSGFLYGIRDVHSRAGSDPNDPVTATAVLKNVRYQPTAAPPPPPFLGTTNLQQSPAGGAPGSPPRAPSWMGFRLHWLPPPSAGTGGQAPWPADLTAFPPMDVVGFLIQRRRADVPGPFAELEEPPALYFGNRGGPRTPPQLAFGADLFELYPDEAQTQPPVSVLMEIEDVLRSPSRQGPPPGSTHQYRIFSVDAIGRRSAQPTLGSVVRLEKRMPPPRPVGSPEAAPPGALQPAGVRAFVLQKSDPGLSSADQAKLGSSSNAVVLRWGWTQKERDLDSRASEFRVYWEPVPPDVVHGRLSGQASLVGGTYQMQAAVDQPLPADAMKGAYIEAPEHAFKVASHTGGQAITIRLEPSQLEPARAPTDGGFVFTPALTGAELRPLAWKERVAVIPVGAAETYEHVLKDRLTVDALHPTVRAWIGVSAADAEPYVADEIGSGQALGGRPGNESSVVAVPVEPRYIGQPVFTVPPPLPGVPEVVTGEPAGASIEVGLPLTTLLPAVSVPPGHQVGLERLNTDRLVALLSEGAGGAINVKLPAGGSASYSPANPADQAAVLAQVRSGVPGGVEGRFLMAILLGQLSQLESLWESPGGAARLFGTVTDSLPAAAARYVHRVRLVDPAGHRSEGTAILPQIVRVPSLRAAAAPVLSLAPGQSGGLTLTARVRDAFDLSSVLVFTLVHDATSALDRTELVRPKLLRLPNRRDLYPTGGIGLQLRNGTVLLPTAVPVTSGVAQMPDWLVTHTTAPGPDKRVALWAASMTRDGIPSALAGPLVALTAPPPLAVPQLTVQGVPAIGVDRASWTALTQVVEVSLERSRDGGTTWTRVAPWLPASQAGYDVAAVSGPRLYRLAVRADRGRSARGTGVVPT